MSWEQRIERAGLLAAAYPFAEEMLGFYREILLFQKSLYDSLCTAAVPAALLPRFPQLLALVQRAGPPPLAKAAAGRSDDGLPELSSSDAAEAFFARALFQPYAEYLAARKGISAPGCLDRVCPRCGHKPQAGVLRPEGHGARRFLVCSLCFSEWEYRRIVCPACSEDAFDKLVVYTADRFGHVRVEACESCKTYLKTVDLTKDGLAVPIVDELAATPLDLWAQEQGYHKLQPNLLL